MRIARMTFIACMLFAHSDVMANQPKEISLEEKSRKSDLVIIGQVASTYTETDDSLGAVAIVRIESRLKGEAKGPVKVRYRTGISEFDPKCCDLNERYVFFLRLGSDGVYQSTNGRFGVYKIDTK